MGFGMFDMLFSVMFPLVFLLVVGMFVVVAVRGIREWSHNNQQPTLTVEAFVVTKRSQYHHHAGDNTLGSTSYYATFQVESGDRMEFRLSGTEYGMLAEGDRGRLTFQGSRYHGFTRMNPQQ